MDNLIQMPYPPHMSEWKFVEEFKEYPRTCWRRPPLKCPAAAIDLNHGVMLVKPPENSGGALDTAYDDFSRFLNELRIPVDCGYVIDVKIDPSLAGESFYIDIRKADGVLRAADLEGIRRAVYFLMDEILRTGGPFLYEKIYRRDPLIKRRISRCYYGPKKRPPMGIKELMAHPEREKILLNDPEYRDELLDNVEYYPDAYLSRLAREGVNGLWITGYFNELCKSTVIPEYGDDSERRLEKLSKVVAKCAKYGIKIFIFCMEPCGFGERIPIEIATKHPEVCGNKNGSSRYFCTSTKAGQAYLEEACCYLFSQVPGLGGLINLCVGERPTNCCSGYITGEVKINCPHCSKRNPKKVIAELLTIMNRGMKLANPDAELIAWPYGQYIVWGEEPTVDAVDCIPKDVILIHNFESRGHTVQLGRERTLDDYWLAYPGPSKLFMDCAAAASKNGIRFGAKIQAGCSYELGTVPFVPVPGILYKKYKAMHELKIDTVMQSWLIGSCPSVMTRAAGMLSFGPFPRTEGEFLRELAAIDWGNDAEIVADAWMKFQKSYENYPYSRIFSYYSPINAGVVWPLYLYPVNKVLFPPFRANRPPCGDRIGECLLDDFTLEEAIELCGKMTDYWSEGLRLLDGIADKYRNDEERRKDIGVATAVGIQIRSCYNILQFYYLRDQLAWTPYFKRKKELLEKLRTIVIKEMANTSELYNLASRDSRLGFQADSECHIYFPEKLNWRLELLKRLMVEEFPAAEAKIAMGEEPFPEYIGQNPGKYSAQCILVSKQMTIDDPLWKNLPLQICEQESFQETAKNGLFNDRKTSWQSCHTSEALYVIVYCDEPDMDSVKKDWELPEYRQADCVELMIEKRQLWPSRKFVVNAGGDIYHVMIETSREYLWNADVCVTGNRWQALFCIPWAFLNMKQQPSKPIRINVKRIIPNRDGKGFAALSWGDCNPPIILRNLLPNDNPADFGWLFLDNN